MTTLVTGAGLIGTAFASCARERGEDIVFFDSEPRAGFLKQKLGDDGFTFVRGDIRNLAELMATVRRHQAGTIVHTAGLIGGRVQQAIGTAFDINLGGTRNVAEAARLAGVRRLVHISTFGVYDLRRPLGANIGEDFPKGPVRAYGAFKAAKELILEAYAAEYGFELVILRPANVFGFGHFWSGSSGGMKMQALLEAGLSGETARITSAETMANEYVYAKDLGRAVDLAASRPMPKEHVFNIGNGYITPFEVVVETVREIYPKLAFTFEPGDPPKSKSVPLDISRAKQHLGWEPRFSIPEAFRDFAAELSAVRRCAAELGQPRP
jgi:nucleoside-diphosphate-sugar epimerase